MENCEKNPDLKTPSAANMVHTDSHVVRCRKSTNGTRIQNKNDEKIPFNLTAAAAVTMMNSDPYCSLKDEGNQKFSSSSDKD